MNTAPAAPEENKKKQKKQAFYDKKCRRYWISKISKPRGLILSFKEEGT